MKTLYFLHGLDGSSKGIKSQFLRKHFPDCIIPDFPTDMQQRLTMLKDLVNDQPSWLIGSSLGGLQALFFADRFPELVKGMILLAPAVGFFDPSWCSVDELEKIEALIVPKNIPAVG